MVGVSLEKSQLLKLSTPIDNMRIIKYCKCEDPEDIHTAVPINGKHHMVFLVQLGDGVWEL